MELFRIPKIDKIISPPVFLFITMRLYQMCGY